MSIVAKLVAAKADMPQLVPDETVRTKSYTFKYASLQAILKVVTPSLQRQGIILVQDVGMHGDIFGVVTKLIGDDDSHISSEVMPIEVTGDSRDLSGRITTARRLQLQSLLGLAADEAEGQPTPRQPVPPPPITFAPDRLRRAAQAGEQPDASRSAELEDLLDAITKADSNEAAEVSTQVREGQSQSAYSYLVSLIPGRELTLSYLFGRVITPGTPPKVTHRFLVDGIKSGKISAVIAEAAALAEKA